MGCYPPRPAKFARPEKNVPNYSTIEDTGALRLSDVLAYGRKYRSSVILATLLLGVLFTIAVFLVPQKFSSSARLLVRLGRGAVSIDPTANLSQTVSLQESRLAQVNSVKDLLAGRELAERVVRKVGADRILQPHSFVETTMSSAMQLISSGKSNPIGDMSADEVAEQIKLEEACKSLAGNVKISAPKDAYTLSIDARFGDPFLARDLVQTYIDEYQKYHVESYQSTGSLGFFEAQTDAALQRAGAAQSALRDAKTSRGIVELSASKLSLGAAISGIKQSIISTDGDLAAAQAELSSLRTLIEKMPANVEAEVMHGIPKVTGTSMRQRLYDLEVSYQEAAVKYTADHPKLLALREQLSAAAKIADSEMGDQTQSREAINPIRQQLELSQRSTEARLAGITSKRSALEKQLGELTDDLALMNQDEVELNKLTWEATLAETEYLRSAATRATVRQINDLDEQNLSEISIVQPATLSLKKASPKRSILLMLAAILAVTLGYGQAVVRGMAATNPQQPVDVRMHDDSHHDEPDYEVTVPVIRPMPMEHAKVASPR